MNFKRKVPLNLDAAIVLVVVLVSSLIFNFVQMQQIVELNKETSKQGVQSVLDQMNLTEVKKRVKELEHSCELSDSAGQ